MRESVAWDGDPSQVLLVLRPQDDPDLPDVWGLPAVSLRTGESWEEAVARVGREKLGVRLGPGRLLAEGEGAREQGWLRMRLYEARVEKGTPHVPQPVAGVTQYASWRWGRAADLEPGARRGSLCCRLFLARERRS